MNPDQIKLDNLSKSFEYHKLANEIDSVSSIDVVKDIAKSYVKLYLKQQEVMSSI